MQILQGHTDIVPALLFAPDGSLLASSSYDSTIRLWHFPSGAAGPVIATPHRTARNLSFSPDGRWLAVSAPEPQLAAWVWELAHLDRRIDLPLSGGGADALQYARALAFTPDSGQLVVAGVGRFGRTGRRQDQQERLLFRRWEAGSWTELPGGDVEIPMGTDWRRQWSLSPRLDLLAIADSDRVLFWDLQTGKERFHLPDIRWTPDLALAFSPEGRRFAVARVRSLLVCDVAEQRLVASWKSPTTNRLQSLAFAPDGRTLVTVSNDTVARFWDAATGHEKAAYGWGIGPLKAVAFAPDGLRAAASGDKGTIVVWDID